MKKIICLLLMLCLCAPALPVSGESPGAVTVSSEADCPDGNVPPDDSAPAATGEKLEINAKSAVLMEPYTGKILYEDNADEVQPPASITKIMSLLLVMEAIDRGTLTLKTPVTASEHACSMGGSQIWLEPGETMTVNELLKAAVIASANDATVALGEAVAGSEEGFVARMNKRAAQLGMTRTKFINCTGLDAEGHVSTAHDVALMSCALIRHELIKQYSTVWMDSLRDGKSELVNTNKLVRFYPGTTGLKTGTTSGAGYCLSATAQRDGLSLVAVIMGGKTSQDRFNGAKKLLDFGFANYSFAAVAPELKAGLTVPVKKGTSRSVPVRAEKSLGVLMKKADTAAITKKTVLEKNVAAPVKKGQRVGTVDVYVGGEQVGSVPVTAAAAVGRLSYGVTLHRLLRGMFVL